MRSRNSLPLLFLSFTLSAVFSSILPFLLVRCSQVLMKKVRRSYSLSRLRPRSLQFSLSSSWNCWEKNIESLEILQFKIISHFTRVNASTYHVTPSIPPTVHSYTQTAYPSFSRVVPSLFPLVASPSLARLALSSVSFLPSRVQPTVKEKFSPGNSLPAGYRCIDESLRESRGNWMTATRREVSIRWFNQLARDA